MKTEIRSQKSAVINPKSEVRGRKPAFGLLSLVMFILSSVFGLLSSAFGAGTDPSAFLSYGIGARALALGGAYTGVAEDASATYYNPGALGALLYRELTASHCILWENTGYTFIGYVHPMLEKGTLGFNIINLNSGGAELRDINNTPQGQFNNTKTALSLTYGKQLANKLYMGFNGKYFNSNLASNSVSFFTCDMGAFYRLNPSLSFGLNLQNMIPLTLGNTDDSLPLNLKLGTGYRLLEDKLLVAFDFNGNSESGSLFNSYSFGFEYKALRFLDLRLGKNPQELTFGFGVSRGIFGFDYGLALNDYLGPSHRISFGVKFGKIEAIELEKLKPIEVAEVPSDEEKARKEEEFKKVYQEAVTSYRSGDYAEALNKFKSAEEVQPDDVLVPLYLQKLESIIRIVPQSMDKSKASELVRRGIQAYLEGNDDTAVKTIAYAWSLKPNDFTLDRLLREVEQKTGIKAERATLATGLSVVDQKLYESLMNFRKRDYWKAIGLCEDVLQLEPNNLLALKRMGSAFYALGEKQKAKEFWQRALRIKDDTELRKLINTIK